MVPNQYMGMYDPALINKAFDTFLQMPGEQLLESLGMLQKAGGGGGDSKDMSVLPPPTRSFIDYSYSYSTTTGVRERERLELTPNTLREIDRKNPIVSAITNTRCRQVKQFARPSKDMDAPGFRIRTIDEEHKPSRGEKAEMQEIEQWLLNTGRTDFEGWDEREDRLIDGFNKMARDFLVIDSVAIEPRRDSRGRVVDFWFVDGATIKRVLQSGFTGKKTDIDPRVFAFADKDFYNRLVEARVALIPEDLTKVAFVQELEGRYVAAYTRQDLILESMQKRSDTRFWGVGYPPVAQAMTAVSAFLWGMAYNAEAFNRGAVPKIGLSFDDASGLSQEQIKQYQDEWIANYRGIRGAWRIPIFQKKVQVLDFLKSPRDMEYMKYLEFVGALIAAVMGMDLAEVGLRYQQAQSVLSENVDAKQKFSKDRGLHDMLYAYDGVMNKLLRIAGYDWHKKFVFEFTGLSPEDRQLQSGLDNAKVRRNMTVNEYRRSQDMPEDPYGDIILDPSYIQYRLQKEQGEAMAGAGAGADSAQDQDYGDVVDEAVEAAFGKAMKAVFSPRTLLK